jgi:PAS domain S-box-containing protein
VKTSASSDGETPKALDGRADAPGPEGAAPLTVRQRIAFGFATAVLLIVVTGVVAFHALHETVANNRATVSQARDVIEFGRLRAAIEKKLVAVRGFLITGDEKFLAEIERSHREARAQIAGLRSAGLSAKEGELLSEIERTEAEHQKATEQAVALKLGGADAGYFAETMEPARETLERRLSAYLSHESQLLEETDRASTTQNFRASILIGVSVAATVILTVGLGIALTRRLARIYDIERDERRLAETARARYRDLMEGIPGGIVWEADASTLKMSVVSRRAQEMLGYPREEELGEAQFWTRLIHPEDRERVLAALARALQEPAEQQFEHRFQTAGGRTVWFQTRVRRREVERKPAVLRGLSVGITRLKEAEEALRLRARQQAAVVRLGQQALVESDLALFFERACQAVVETLDADLVAILELTPDGREFLLRAGAGWKEGSVGAATIPAGTNTQPGYTLLAGEPVVVPDMRREERFREPALFADHGVVSGASVVIASAAAPSGVLSVHARVPRIFSAEDVSFLQSVANVLSAATGRKVAEQAVQESERRKAAILEGALDAVVTIDYEGRIIEFNPAAERMFGFAADDVVGRVMADLIVPERLRGQHHEGMAAYLVAGQGKVLNRRLEMPALRSDGSEFPVELAITRISGGGPPVFTGFLRDITNRKRSEEERTDLLVRERRARAAAETARERAAFLAEASAGLASSLDHRTTLASVARLLVPRIADGCAVDMIDAEGQLRRLVTSHSNPSRTAAAEEVAGRYPPQLGAPHGAGHVAATGESELLSEVTDDILRQVARNEEHYELIKSLGILSLMCVPLPVRGRILGAITFASSESGRRFGVEDLAFAQDLAGRVSAAIENARLYREAREAVRAREEFLSIASHELKTPLTTLQLQVQGLARKVQSTPGEPALRVLGPRLSAAERQVERLTALINNLLDISRITAGRLDLDLEPVDLSGVVRDAAARVREDLARAGCALELRTDGPCIGQWDRIRLEQVVSNLLSNAIKYGAGRPIVMTVAGDQATARFTIRDHGIGIPPEDRARIFERFERAVSDRHYGGLGLGLWIVRQIVDAFGGTIEVNSEAGQGSVFNVLLPKAGSARRSTRAGA